MNYRDLKIGMQSSVTKTITETDIVLYSGISLDINPVHINENYAAETFFQKTNSTWNAFSWTNFSSFRN